MKIKLLTLALCAFAFGIFSQVFARQITVQTQPTTDTSFLDKVPSVGQIFSNAQKATNLVVVSGLVVGGVYMGYKLVTNKSLRNNIAVVYDLLNSDKLEEILQKTQAHADQLDVVNKTLCTHGNQLTNLTAQSAKIKADTTRLMKLTQRIEKQAAENTQKLFQQIEILKKKGNKQFTQLDKKLDRVLSTLTPSYKPVDYNSVD